MGRSVKRKPQVSPPATGKVTPNQGKPIPPKPPQDTPAAVRARRQADPPTNTFSVDAFQTDLFTGAATAEIPIVVPPGAAGVAPKIALRYSSAVTDQVGSDQAEWTGLGWNLDVGGFILRDTKGTTDPNDDTFKLVFGGVSYDLVLVDSGQKIYHTKDETFWKLQWNQSSDYWTLTTKDGTVHRFGYNADSKALAVGQDLWTQTPWKYLLDEVKTTSGTSVRYSYVKQTAHVFNNSGNQTYDQAVYPNVITYAYNNGSLVGSAREVHFNLAPRYDYTDTTSSTNPLSFFESSRIDSIEVKVGGSLARKYVLGFDYSIPNVPYGGGATGDLTLRSLTVYGTDGATALPPLTFDYSGSVLASANNGMGGSVSYGYDQIAPLYWNCVNYDNDSGNCVPRGWALATTAGDPWEGSSLLGVVSLTNVQGTIPLYWVCTAYDNDAGNCSIWGPTTSLSNYQWWAEAPAVLLGYITTGGVDRHRYRVTSRTIDDGLGWSSTTDFAYWSPSFVYNNPPYSDPEFRGHGQVRATDPLGNYTDTFFYQDDALKGRPYQIETRSNAGDLFTQVQNTWSASTPYSGVTFASLSRTDKWECDGQANCRDVAKTFSYDSYGNPTQTASLGDPGFSGDERTENTDWTVDTTNWIHRPGHVTLLDTNGALVRERWLSYDPLGRLTRQESRLAGNQNNPGNPVVTHTYDNYGNRTSTTDPIGCATTTVYETSQTYPATVTNCLGHITSFQYDARFGEKTSETDPNQQQTTYNYDTFGRLTKVTGPLDGSSTYGTVSYFYVGWGYTPVQRVQTFRTTQSGTSNFIWSEEYFDGLGRVDLTRSLGPGWQTILTETTFDPRGQVAAKSAPHFDTEAAAWTQFSYDALGRETLVINPDGTSSTKAYSPGLVTMTDENGKVKRNVLDAYDQVARVDEVNGNETYSTLYGYDTAGSLTGVSNHLGQVTSIGYDLLGRKFGMSDPNMGSWFYAYDPAGNLIAQTDAKQQTIGFEYDLLGRLKKKTYPDQSVITWTYDDPAVPYSKGRLTKVVDLAGETRFSYDQVGRVTQTDRILDGVTYTMAQSYDAQGKMTSETFPDNDQVTYYYNEAGWLNYVPGYINSVTYDARGQKTQLQYANGVTSNWTYNAQNFRVTNHSTSGPGGNLQDLSYTYDNVGNISTITDGLFTGSRVFTYDALNRLIEASGTFGANQSQMDVTYSYNAIGDIINKAGRTFYYNDPNHPSAVTGTSDGKSYSYDANGNMLTGNNRTFTWDYDNRVTALNGGTVSMAYDYTGARVKKTSGGTTYYPFNGYEVAPGGQITKYIRIGIETVAAKRSNGQTLFYHNDHLGGVNVITDLTHNGARVQLIEYLPWGGMSRQEGSVDPTHGFTGQELDPESGLYYYGARYYDYDIGRFISPDSIVPEPLDPQSLNRYSYVINNPVNHVDPTGHCFFIIDCFIEFLIIDVLEWEITSAISNAIMAVTIAEAVADISLFSYHVMQTVNNKPSLLTVGQAKTATSPALQQQTGDDCPPGDPRCENRIEIAACVTPSCLPGNKPKKPGEPQQIKIPTPKNGQTTSASGQQTSTTPDRNKSNEKQESKESTNPQKNPLNLDRAIEILRDLARGGEEMSRGQVCSEIFAAACTAASLGAFGLTENPTIAAGTALTCALTAYQVCTQATQPPGR